MARKPPAVLDDVSKGIIEQLQQDGRRSYAAIGKVVGLSEAAVRQRVQRLVDSGVMQVVAVTDPLQLGFARQAMVGIRVNGQLEPVADALAELPEVDYVVITAGSYDLLAEVVCESDDHLLTDLGQDPDHRGRGLDRDVHVPQAAQADLLLGRALNHVPLGGRPRLPPPPARRWTATSTSTSPSSAPASPACGPPTTWRRAEPGLRIAVLRGRGRGLRRLRTQRRMVLRAVPRVLLVAGGPQRPHRSPGPARGDAGDRRRGRAGARRGGHRRPLRPGRHDLAGPQPRPAGPGPGRGRRRPGRGGAGRTRSGCSTPPTPASVLAGSSVHGATYTPDCAAIHPLRLARGLADAVVRLGVRLFEHTPALAIGPGRLVTPDRGWSGPTPWSARPRATPPPPRRRRRLVPIYSLVIATEPLPDRSSGSRSGCAAARRSPTTGT